ncbi:MAG: hypothetical protein WAU25_09815 [Nitrososphaeraceae archaeon]
MLDLGGSGLGERSLAEIIVKISCQIGAFHHFIIGRGDTSMDQIAGFPYELHAPSPPLRRVCDPNLLGNFQFAFKARGGGTSL